MMTPVEFEQAHYGGNQPRAATRMRAAENLGRFIHLLARAPCTPTLNGRTTCARF